MKPVVYGQVLSLNLLLEVKRAGSPAVTHTSLLQTPPDHNFSAREGLGKVKLKEFEL